MSDLFAEAIVRAILSIYHKDSSGFDFIRALEQRTGMSFIHETSDPENLCYANSQAIRPEYKTSFTTADLWNYINNQPNLKSNDTNNLLKSIVPKSQEQFWHAVHQNKGTPKQSQS